MSEPSTTLYLTRHGQTQWNLEQRLQGQLNSPLTQLGKNQAFHTQQKLLNKNIHIAYSSPLLRAIETTALIIGDWPVKMLTRDNLSEIHLGPWEGKTYTEIQQSHPIEFQNFWHQPDKYQLPGAENFLQLQQRVIQEIKSIIDSNIGKNILVVSHGIAIKVILAYVLKKCLSDLGQIDVMDNGDYICLEHNNDQIRLGEKKLDQNQHAFLQGEVCFG